MTGENPLVVKSQAAPGPAQTDYMLGIDENGDQNATQIVTAGTTVQVCFLLHLFPTTDNTRASPAAFNVYSTVKIVTVPAVTDSMGKLVCTTRSTASGFGLSYDGINSYAEAYFGGLDISTSWYTTEMLSEHTNISSLKRNQQLQLIKIGGESLACNPAEGDQSDAQQRFVARRKTQGRRITTSKKPAGG